MQKIEMLDQVEDRITGFKGTVTAYAVYLNGCTKIMVTPRVDKDGKTGNAEWIDEQDIVVVERHMAQQEFAQMPTGGPQATPPGY